MRPCYSLLVIASCLLATCNAAATESKVLQLVSNDATLWIQQFARAKTDNTGKRLLRSKMDDEDPAEIAENGEERGFLDTVKNIFKNKQYEHDFKEKAIQAMLDSKGTPDTLYRGLSLGRKGENHPDYKVWKAFKKVYKPNR
ncbi:hypothetical protein PHYBOEH_006448 [Phytophthora boehmeriae]|uniref:RxLR effector protein n=1 Tax=Phytophthora boehmeriae TaxID=109152 RepID=A0A8T1WER7_9STRA|nr:hypothetical protein PHYBOEH_006448 [Phytophthora boehmeriae]